MGSEQCGLAAEWWRVFWRGVTTPWLATVWLLALMGLLGIATSSRDTFIGSRVSRDSRVCYSQYPTTVFAVNGGYVAADSETLESDRLEAEAEVVGWVTYAPRWYQEGLWMPTALVRGEVFRFSLLDEDLRDDPSIRAAVFDCLQTSGSAGTLDPRHRTAGFRQSRVLWWGYAGNMASVFVCCALVGSARRLPESLVDRRASRIAAGLCPRCGYSIVGLPEPRCPECGEQVG